MSSASGTFSLEVGACDAQFDTVPIDDMNRTCNDRVVATYRTVVELDDEFLLSNATVSCGCVRANSIRYLPLLRINGSIQAEDSSHRRAHAESVQQI